MSAGAAAAVGAAEVDEAVMALPPGGVLHHCHCLA